MDCLWCSYETTRAGAAHDFASGMLCAFLMTAFGLGGLLAIVLASRGSRIGRTASALRTLRLVATTLAFGVAVTLLSRLVTTEVRVDGEAIERAGLPAYFAHSSPASDSPPPFVSDWLPLVVDALFWTACLAFLLTFLETGRARYIADWSRRA